MTSNIIFEETDVLCGLKVKSMPDGLQIINYGDLDYDKTIIIPWDKILKAMPIGVVKGIDNYYMSSTLDKNAFRLKKYMEEC